MTNKEKLMEATMLALQGKINESEKKELQSLEKSIQDDREELQTGRLDSSDKTELNKTIIDKQNKINQLKNKKELTESHNDIIEFKVNNLIKQNLTNDRDISKAQDLLKAYNDFRKIAKNYIDVPYDVCKLGENGMEHCYQHLAQLLGTDKLN